MNISDSQKDTAENEAIMQALHEQDKSLEDVAKMISQYEEEIAEQERSMNRSLTSEERYRLLHDMQEEETTESEIARVQASVNSTNQRIAELRALLTGGLDLSWYIPVYRSTGLVVTQTLEVPFSTVSKPLFAIEGAFSKLCKIGTRSPSLVAAVPLS